MKKLLESIAALGPFLEAYPTWVKALISVWVLLTAVVLIVLVFVRPPADTAAAQDLPPAGTPTPTNDPPAPATRTRIAEETNAVGEEFVGTIDYGGDVKGIDFSPDGRLIATGGGNNHTASLWNAGTGERLRLLAGNSVVSSVAFSTDGTRFATDSDLFDLVTGERVATLGGGYDVAFSPDGRFLATASGYTPSLGTRLYDQTTGALIRQISDEYAPSLAFSHDGTLLATATGYLGMGVRLWSLDSEEPVRTLEGPSETVAFSPDGRYIATVGGGTVRLFRPLTGEQVRDINGLVVAFSPDGRALATTGEDRRVQLYDPANGNPIRTLENVYATDLVFSPDGQRIATVGPDGSIQISRAQ